MDKFYLFYINLDLVNTNKWSPLDSYRNGKDSYRLYAITNNKEYYKYFRATRDMTKFVSEIITIDEDEYKDFIFEHESEVLEIRGLRTKSLSFDDEEEERRVTLEKDKIQILMTNFEYEVILNDSYEYISEEMNETLTLIEHVLGKNATMYINGTINNFINLFEQDIQQALRILNLSNGISDWFDMEPEIVTDIPWKLGSVPIDMLGVYCSMFGETYR